MRLQQYLAKAGVASRRRAEEIISDGRVTVNGEIVLAMGKNVEEGDTVMLDGVQVKPQERLVTVMYYKPRGVVSTASDDHGRRTVTDAVSSLPERLYPVGRLDMDSEGLILLTNDGELALKLTHPSYGVVKRYAASVEGHVTGEAIQRLRRGVLIDGRMTAPAIVERIESGGAHEKLSITIHEGRNRQVRKMLEAVGNSVVRLVRVSVGPLTIKGLKPGEWRELTDEELTLLKDSIGSDLRPPVQEPAAGEGGASAKRGENLRARDGSDRPPASVNAWSERKTRPTARNVSDRAQTHGTRYTSGSPANGASRGNSASGGQWKGQPARPSASANGSSLSQPARPAAKRPGTAASDTTRRRSGTLTDRSGARRSVPVRGDFERVIRGSDTKKDGKPED